MSVALLMPEPDESINVIFIDGEFVVLGSIDDFLEKNYEKFSKTVNN